MTKRIAIHEAGHAVAHAVLGLPPNVATIVQDGETLGSVTSPNPTYGYTGTDRGERQSRQRDAIVATLAGRAAEHVLLGEPFTFDDESGSAADYHEAWQLMLSCKVRYSLWVGDEKYEAAFERLQKKALQLVRLHAREIRLVAESLMARGTLTGPELRALIIHE